MIFWVAEVVRLQFSRRIRKSYDFRYEKNKASECDLILHEGRYRQIRKMFAAVDNHVVQLHRKQIGGLTVGDLALGEWRIATNEDKMLLFKQP